MMFTKKRSFFHNNLAHTLDICVSSLKVCNCNINFKLDYFRAISSWYEARDWFNSLCKTVMEQDWSWNRPALDYLELYHAARKLA